MTIPPDTLADTLGVTFTPPQTVRAQTILERASRTVRVAAVKIGGAAKVEDAEGDEDSDGHAALVEATLLYAVDLYSNPEGLMQERHRDYARSMGDSTEAVKGLPKRARDILRDAFARTSGTARIA